MMSGMELSLGKLPLEKLSREKLSREKLSSEKLSRVELDSFIQPKQLVSQRILQYVRAMQNAYESSVESLYPLFDGRIEAVEFIASSASACTNKPLKSLPIRPGVLVAAINRAGAALYPPVTII
jgi:trk system potassium uptake protein TrkA